MEISIISKIEVLSIKEAEETKIAALEKFLSSFRVIGLYEEIAEITAALRRKQKLTLADAIVLATAIYLNATLVTNDKELLKKSKKFLRAISINP